MDQLNFINGLFQSIIILILAFVIIYKYSDLRTKTTHFICPQCNNRYKLSKLYFALAFKSGVINERIVTCSVFGHKGKISIVNDY